MELKVIVNKLNQRTQPVDDFSTRNIVGTVQQGYRFTGEKVPFPTNLGDWYKDANGQHYWGGGLQVVATDPPAVVAPGELTFTFRKENSKHYATVEGKEFYFARETPYDGRYGLFNTRADEPLYAPAEYHAQYGFWAYFIYPTAMCESKGSFWCLNTYDRALFTFTFMQFAAHVPEGDFVRYFRRLLGLPRAAAYFPDLELRNGNICLRSTGKPLETKQSTIDFMHYLNPGSSTVDRAELLSSARMVHWAQNDPEHRSLQVKCAVDLMKENMKEYAVSYNLNGQPDYICQAICDIRHQGRASSKDIRSILSTYAKDPLKMHAQLVNVGKSKYADRVATLGKTHQQLIQQGIFKYRYNAATGEFQ